MEWASASSRGFCKSDDQRSSVGPFPLTPTLSLGERENRWQSFSRYRVLATKPPSRVPLPKGEGWGEGKETSKLGFLYYFGTVHGKEAINAAD